jgi:hypothetical protein
MPSESDSAWAVYPRGPVIMAKWYRGFHGLTYGWSRTGGARDIASMRQRVLQGRADTVRPLIKLLIEKLRRSSAWRSRKS